MKLPGEDLTGVFDALKFLKTGTEKTEIKGKVVVVGGGNSAIDSARVALRKGAQEVHILYRRERKDMPAIAEEIEAAEDEGIHLHCLILPTRILGEKGKVVGIEYAPIELKEFDQTGRRTPHSKEESRLTIKADMVIVAIGQRPDPPVPDHGKITLAANRSIIINKRTFQTNLDGVFAGGDVVGGEGTIIDAILAGQKAAFSIKRYLEGKLIPLLFEREDDEVFDLPLPERNKEITQNSRISPRPLDLKRRVSSLDEVVQGYSTEEAVEEASRCLRCDAKQEEKVTVTAHR